MKKTFITLLALAGVSIAGAATNLVYWGGTENMDIITFDAYRYTPYIALETENNGSTTLNRAPESVVTAITTVGNADYNLIFDPSKNTVGTPAVPVVTPIFQVSKALYLNRFTVRGTTQPTSFSIDFGSNGSINTQSKTDSNGGGINFGVSVKGDGGAITFNASLNTEQLATLSETGYFSRNLLSAVNNGGNGIWNLTDAKSFAITLSGMDEYVSKGMIESEEDLQEGEYGLLVAQNISEESGRISYATLVVKGIQSTTPPNVPEPTTATLSLLALAGLAARRRRK